ncbi:MAG TPA: STAS domain-containing protein [Acidimicrobiales bacterium]
MANGLDINVAEIDGSVDLAVGGDIDLETSHRFNRALRDAVFEAVQAHKAVNLDLSQVTFMGSTGISSLVQTRQLALDEGVTLRIVEASKQVKRVLELMALNDYFR